MGHIFSILIFTILIIGEHAFADHENHVHEKKIDGAKLEINQEKFAVFTEGLNEGQIAVVSVKGMVCDFCARGIEKIFKRDPEVIKIDVDLDFGQVLIAYTTKEAIDNKDIRKKIRKNGIDVVSIEIPEF